MVLNKFVFCVIVTFRKLHNIIRFAIIKSKIFKPMNVKPTEKKLAADVS